MLESGAMRNALAALVLAAGPLAAQEAVQKPNLFPPVAQILGSDAGLSAQARAADFDTLSTRLNAADPQTRRLAAAELGWKDNVRAVPFLGATLLKLNENVEVRVAAAMALGRIGNWRCGTFLRQSIRDAAREVRFASALALVKTKSQDSVSILANTLEKDEDWWVRFAAAVALAENRSPESVAALARSAEKEPEWQVRMQAVRSLGQIGSRDAALALEKPLHDSDSSVRAATALALGDIGGLDALHLLAGALHEEREDFPRQMMADSIKKLLSK
jgi:HEAT repeat protein